MGSKSLKKLFINIKRLKPLDLCGSERLEATIQKNILLTLSVNNVTFSFAQGEILIEPTDAIGTLLF